MRVRALSTGFIYNQRVRAGTVFELPKNIRIGRWMEPLDDEAKAAKKVEDTRRQRKAEEEHQRQERLRKLYAGEVAAQSTRPAPTAMSEMTRAAAPGAQPAAPGVQKLKIEPPPKPVPAAKELKQP